MIIGIAKEIKAQEYRVAMTPSGVSELVRGSHLVLIEKGAGEGSGFTDHAYEQAGASLVDRQTLFSRAALIVKVKEPLPEEYDLFQPRQALYTYLHLAANPPLLEMLIKKELAAFGYETLQVNGALPLLAPMSEIAGRMAPIIGTYYLQKSLGGTGVLTTGAATVKTGKAVILGAGTVGSNAARICVGLGMETVVMNRSLAPLQQLDRLYQGRLQTLPLQQDLIAEEIAEADLLIGAVLVPGGRTPIIISHELLKIMKLGAVIIDVSVDQGGCVATSRPTTHDNPVYTIKGIIHYAVANMPGAYPRTATLALTNATLPSIKLLADRGIEAASREDSPLYSALQVAEGAIVHPALARDAGIL
ncbi:MAG: alanine dehydrogenase [Deltaproteobacteria bacterium]|nr:alanine dehydrogenase [Candidatus Anaeroferrophillus wilburensis]MBN2890090.1 alanine dehydrogenase [Deltaproteobacteria bacterium]